MEETKATARALVFLKQNMTRSVKKESTSKPICRDCNGKGAVIATHDESRNTHVWTFEMCSTCRVNVNTARLFKQNLGSTFPKGYEYSSEFFKYIQDD